MSLHAHETSPFFLECRIFGSCFFVVGMGWPHGVSAMLPNPDFADHDGNGIPDGWEVKTFVMETFGKKIPCLSMKFQRDTDRPLEGEISTKFEGPAGFYRVRISYLDDRLPGELPLPSQGRGGGQSRSLDRRPRQSGWRGGGILAKPTGDVVRVQFFSLGAEGRDQGFIVEESKPLSAGEPIQLAWTAPKDGLYRINVQTTDRNGRVAVDFGERPHVMAVHPVQRKDFLPLVKAPARKTSADDQDMMPNRFFFYVPSGTKAFVVNARRTSPRDPVAVQFFSLQDAFGLWPN